MPTFGLVIRLSSDAAAADLAIERLGRDPRVACGEETARCVPVVLTTRDAREESEFIDAYLRDGGVEQIDVAYANFEDLDLDARSEESDRGYPT